MIFNKFNTVGEVIDCKTSVFKEYVNSSSIGELSQLHKAITIEFNRSISTQKGLTERMKNLIKGTPEFDELKRVSQGLYSKMFMMEEKCNILSAKIDELSTLNSLEIGDK